MRNLTWDEFEEAPGIIKWIYMSSVYKQGIGSSMYEDAIKNHPEYFPDELEYRKKWALIPQEAHDAFFKEREILREECYKTMPPTRGILARIEDPAYAKQWDEEWAKCYEIERPLLRALHEKHYGPYEIEFKNWF